MFLAKVLDIDPQGICYTVETEKYGKCEIFRMVDKLTIDHESGTISHRSNINANVGDRVVVAELDNMEQQRYINSDGEKSGVAHNLLVVGVYPILTRIY